MANARRQGRWTTASASPTTQLVTVMLRLAMLAAISRRSLTGRCTASAATSSTHSRVSDPTLKVSGTENQNWKPALAMLAFSALFGWIAVRRFAWEE